MYISLSSYIKTENFFFSCLHSETQIFHYVLEVQHIKQFKKQLMIWSPGCANKGTYLRITAENYAVITEKGLMIIFSLYPLTKGTKN